MAGEMLVDAVAGGVVAGDDGGAAGGADGVADRELVEVGAFFDEAIEVGGFEVGVVVGGEVAPAPVVGVNEEDVGAGVGGMGEAAEDTEKNNEGFHGGLG